MLTAISGDVQNPSWYFPIQDERGDAIFFKDTHIGLENLRAAFSSWADLEMVISDDTGRGAGGVNVVAVFKPKFDLELKLMTSDQWHKSGYLGVQSPHTHTLFCYDAICPPVFTDVRAGCLSKKRIAVRIESPSSVLRMVRKSFLLWMLEQRATTTISLLKAAPTSVFEEIDTWVNRPAASWPNRDACVASLSEQTQAFIYLAALAYAGDKLAREKVIAITEDGMLFITKQTGDGGNGENAQLGRYMSAMDVREQFVASLTTGRHDTWKLRYYVHGAQLTATAATKVVFLDIDGTLTRGRFMNAPGAEEEFKRLYGTQERTHTRCSAVLTMFFDAGAMLQLEQFLARYPEVKLVLSSNWRVDSWGPAQLREVFGRHACLADRLIGCTPDGDKYEGIQAWLATHPSCTRYAILDDHWLCGSYNMIQVDDNKLLCDADVARLVDVLELQHAPPAMGNIHAIWFHRTGVVPPAAVANLLAWGSQTAAGWMVHLWTETDRLAAQTRHVLTEAGVVLHDVYSLPASYMSKTINDLIFTGHYTLENCHYAVASDILRMELMRDLRDEELYIYVDVLDTAFTRLERDLAELVLAPGEFALPYIAAAERDKSMLANKNPLLFNNDLIIARGGTHNNDDDKKTSRPLNRLARFVDAYQLHVLRSIKEFKDFCMLESRRKQMEAVLKIGNPGAVLREKAYLQFCLVDNPQDDFSIRNSYRLMSVRGCHALSWLPDEFGKEPTKGACPPRLELPRVDGIIENSFFWQQIVYNVREFNRMRSKNYIDNFLPSMRYHVETMKMLFYKTEAVLTPAERLFENGVQKQLLRWLETAF